MRTSAMQIGVAIVLTFAVLGPAAGISAAESGHGPGVAHNHHGDHGAAPAQKGVGRRLVEYVGKFHPMAVHFPIALMIAAAAAELLGMATGRDLFTSAARFAVWCAGISAVAAAAMGWCVAGFQLTDPMQVKTWHRWTGTATGLWAILSILLCHLAYRQNGRKWRRWYLFVLFTGAALVGVTGFLGGAMIYGLDHLAW